MVHEIGVAAGGVWHYLESNGTCTIDDLRKGLRIKEPLLLMAIGWLAREEKLSFDAEGKTLRISLS